MNRRLVATAILLFAVPLTAYAQVIADTVFTWQAYAERAKCRLVLYRTVASEKRPVTAVLDELAGNSGPSITADAPYLVDRIGRAFGFDPANAIWIFRWTASSFSDETGAAKELLLRATFNRTKSQRLGSPSWRVVTREDVENYTDRLLLPQQ